MFSKRFSLALVFLVTASLWAGPGESGFSFLKIGVGGQAAGMGEATVAHITDATAAFWNPALMTFQSGRSAVFTYNRWIEGLKHHAFAFRWPAGDQVFAVYALYTGVDGIERRDIPSDEPIGFFSSHDLALGASYARPLGERFAAGITVKYIYERIYVSSAQALAVDIGFTHKLRFLSDYFGSDDRWRIGAAITNIGFSGKMNRQRITLPAAFRMGTAVDVVRDRSANHTFTFAADVIRPWNDGFKLAMGSEFVYHGFAAIRLGYQFGYDSRSFTAGLGLKIWNRLAVDYGIMPMSNGLGVTHRVTTAVNF